MFTMKNYREDGSSPSEFLRLNLEDPADSLKYTTSEPVQSLAWNRKKDYVIVLPADETSVNRYIYSAVFGIGLQLTHTKITGVNEYMISMPDDIRTRYLVASDSVTLSVVNIDDGVDHFQKVVSELIEQPASVTRIYRMLTVVNSDYVFLANNFHTIAVINFF